ncbi:MAG: HAD family hydrolase [Gammaproteobacteria bacterium]
MTQLMATDLDGTLLDSRSRLSAANRAALTALGEAGVMRAIVTGRSLYSALKVIDGDWPIDFLVFSTGAGIVRWQDRELVRALHMAPAQASSAAQTLIALELDFMLHAPVPDNHHFWFRRADRTGGGSSDPRGENEDFDRRIERYAESARAWPPGWPGPVAVRNTASGRNGGESAEFEAAPAGFSQLLAVENPRAPSRYTEVVRRLCDLSVIRSTSPLDHESWWIEIFPKGVSKSEAVAWLCETEGLDRAGVTALGNDYNDEDMLAWAPRGWVVANAVTPLLEKFPVVSANDADGFADAVERLMRGG